MAGVDYSERGPEGLDEIKELWLLLNQHHLERSVHFRSRYEGKEYSSRKREMLDRAEGGELRVFLAFTSPQVGPVGYCVSIVDIKNVGEVESIFVRPDCRGHGIGLELLRRSLEWLDSRSPSKVLVEVAWGNQEAFRFYEQLGFYPRRAVLERPKDQP